ncbi:MAG: DUF1598 domain-containing protein [Planctomycetia bacterium]
MNPPSSAVSLLLRRVAVCCACAIGAVAVASPGRAHAQMGGMGMGGFGAVGGISVDADGIVRNLDPKAVEALAKERRLAVAGAAAARGQDGKLRKVSLARIVAAAQAAGAGRPLPPDVLYLGGLERITHVFVDPDGHDIILAGPADALAVDAAGNVVAAGSGRPLLQLEDLIVALRSADAVRQGGIKCSIDPTAEGITRLQTLLRNQKTIGQNPDATLVAMQDAMGPQRVTVGGVPGDSRFARVLVAADYRMKRVGMGLEPSGIAEVPSYLSMVPPGSTAAANLPRFWLEADYEPISRDPDELAWRINGRRMKCLTENDLFDADGVRKQAGGKAPDKLAQKWCDLMTSHYDRLAVKQPVFAELVNCVDLAVVAALIHGRQLAGRAGLDLAPLLDAQKLRVPSYDVPASVPTVAQGLKKGNRWVVSASGGVMVQPWSFAANTAESTDVAATRTTALAVRPADGCWWE